LLGRRPFALSISLKAVFKLMSQFKRTGDQLSRPAQKLIDADWFASAHDCDQIKFANFHLLPPKAKGILADYNRRSVYRTGADKPRGHIDGIANYREAFGEGGSDRAHDYFSGRNSHTHTKSGCAATQPDEIWQLFVETVKRRLLLERRETGTRCVSVTWGKWRRPKGHESIAYIFVDNTVIVTDRGCHGSEVVVWHIDDGGGRQFSAQRGEPGDVREESGDPLPLRSIEFSGRGRNQIGHNPRIDELTKCVLYFFSDA